MFHLAESTRRTFEQVCNNHENTLAAFFIACFIFVALEWRCKSCTKTSCKKCEKAEPEPNVATESTLDQEPADAP